MLIRNLVIGPVAGAFLSEAEGWRWVFRVLTIAVSSWFPVLPKDMLIKNLCSLAC
jgi:MFS family permease